MTKTEASNWMEHWADRHNVRLQRAKRLRPGERRVGLVRQFVPGQFISDEALRELAEMGQQLTFDEWGPPPPTASGSAAAGGESPGSITGDRLTERESRPVFRGFAVDQGELFTGVDQVTLTGSGHVQRDQCMKMLAKYLGDGQAGLFGKNFYKESHWYDCGAFIAFSRNREDWSLTLRGQTMRQVGQHRHRQFIIDLGKHTSYATRLDVRVDDYSRELIRIEDFESAVEAGDFSGPRKAKVIRQVERAARGVLKKTGHGVDIGTRSSVRVVVYDKSLESKGEICANRLETGYYDERASGAFERLWHAAIESEASFVKACGELVTGPVDFLRRGEKSHLSRMPRLEFWQRIIDCLGRVRLRVEKSVSTLMGAAKAISRQYARRLGRMAVMAEAAGVDLYHELFSMIESAREGQELHQQPVSPREVGFDVSSAFKPKWLVA